MAELSDAFIALPGGLGTLEELAEVLSWAQLELHAKPIGVLDVGGYFAALVAFLDHATAEGFIAERQRALLLVDDDLDRLLDALRDVGAGRRPLGLRSALVRRAPMLRHALSRARDLPTEPSASLDAEAMSLAHSIGRLGRRRRARSARNQCTWRHRGARPRGESRRTWRRRVVDQPASDHPASNV